MEGGEALRAQKAATVASAVANSSALYRLLSLTDEAFEADPEKDAKWYDVLKIPRPDAKRSSAGLSALPAASASLATSLTWTPMLLLLLLHLKPSAPDRVLPSSCFRVRVLRLMSTPASP